MYCRWDMHEAPPDILVTNYAMLEYMLLRPIERPMWEATREWLAQSSSHCVTLVLDEAHMYTGARGSEVAYLLRRLYDRLGITQRQLRCVATSASLGEGKTSTACNLAVALAQNGKRTILVDGDLRRPAVFKAFGLEKQPGLSEVLQGRLAVKEAIRTVSDVFLGHMSTEDVLRTPGLENLHILTCGGIPSNPAELLSQDRTRDVLQELKDSYDVVLVDGPPLLPVADSVILGAYMDGVVLVYQVGKVGRGVLKRAKVQLDNVGAKVWGIVLNDLTPDLSEFKDESQYYRHYYYKEEPAQRGGWLSRTFGRAPSR